MDMPNKFEFNVDTKIPVLFVDGMAATLKSNEVILLRLGVSMPEGIQEQVRLVIPTDALQRMLDVLCKQTQHYPAKEIKEKVTVKKHPKS